MRQQYFIVVFAHSLHGRLRRVHVPHRFLYVVLFFALFGCVSLFCMASSYIRMTWKVANYNSLRKEVQTLRNRYQDLQRETNQRKEQLASLQLMASEVSLAYGIKRKIEGSPDISDEGPLLPTYRDSLEQYSFLMNASVAKIYHNYPRMWQTNVRPSLWPVNGRLLSPYGARTDPFSGETSSEFHTGVDLSAAMGTPVHATADGIVTHAEWSRGYGKLVVIDHGNGLQTWYAHLSRFDVVAGQEIRRGDILGASGATGHVTAPHLHYEVRVGGNAVNPYPYLSKSPIVTARNKDFPF